jgi:ABC-type transport system involved in multi-copper enzyme maturation permease subunit
LLITLTGETMLRFIIEKELRDIVGSTKFAATFGVCSVLIILSFYVGARSYQSNLIQYEAAKTQNLRQLEGLTDWLNVRQFRIFLPPQTLASLVGGVSNDIGRTTEISGRGELSATDSRYSEDPLFATFRFLDLDFTFQIVLSLLAILFAYDSVNGEKERGTLRLALANAVPRTLFITGKLIGSFLGLVVPLLLPIAMGAFLLPLMGISLTADEWMRFGLIVLAGILYCGAFVTLSVAVSSLTVRTSSSFLFLIVAWIFAVLIIPRSAVLIAGRAVDVPSVDEIGSQKARFSSQLWTEDRAAMNNFKPTSTGNPEKMMQEFQKFMQDQGDVREKKMREFSSRLNEDRENRQAVQERLALGLARVSPTATFSLAATRLAGTSLSLKEHYHNAAEGYQLNYGKFMLAKTGMNPGGNMVIFRMSTDNGEKPKPIDPHELPEFQYVPMSLHDLFPQALMDLLLLVGFNVLLFVLACVGFLRYDVR